MKTELEENRSEYNNALRETKWGRRKFKYQRIKKEIKRIREKVTNTEKRGRPNTWT